MQLSVVIPARNEARHIAGVVRAVREQLEGLCPHEVLVVDNGSEDQTMDLAREAGARLLEAPGSTVAALRNLGVKQSTGTLLLFLDGDVYVTPRWRDRLPTTLRALTDGAPCVTGSRCGIGAQPSWIERSWFAPLATESASYINSGHLLTQRSFFESLGGFDESLETGEDSDFSRRAREKGAAIVNDPELEVLHEGYPKRITDFIRRERWHGKGNFATLSAALRSRVAILTSIFAAGHLLAAVGLLSGAWIPALIPIAVVAGICLLSAVTKYGFGLPRLLTNSVLYYAYFCGRALALFDRLFSRGAAERGPTRGTPR